MNNANQNDRSSKSDPYESRELHKWITGIRELGKLIDSLVEENQSLKNTIESMTGTIKYYQQLESQGYNEGLDITVDITDTNQ